jgi:hypothetical protein
MKVFNYSYAILPLFMAAFVFDIAPVSAQNPVFKAICNVSEVVVGQPFEVAFKLENARIKALSLPNLTDFDVLGPATSIAQSYVNGKTFQMETYTYIFTPKTVGKVTIPAVTVQTNMNTKLTSAPINLKSTKSVAGANNNSNTRRNQGVPDIGDKVLLRINTSNANPVVGEQLVVDLRIYTQVDIRQLDLMKAPRTENVFSHDIRNLNDEPQRISINGKEYTSKILHRAVIFPNKSGKLRLEGGLVSINVVNNEMDGFFAEMHNYKIASEPLEIDVQQPSNMPANFSGTVGEYKMQAYLETPKITTDDAVRLIVRIEGSGDLKQVFAPEISFGEQAFELFPPNVDEKIVDNGKLLGGTKTFEYVLTPYQVGELEIKPNFTFYHPTERRFVRQDTTLRISIALGKNPIAKPKNTPITNGNTAKLDSTKVEILPLAPIAETVLRPTPTTFYGSWWFWLLIAAMPATAVALRRRQVQQSEDPVLQTQKEVKSMKNATTQQLAKAQTYLQAGNTKGFYEEIAQALQLFVSHKLAIPFAELQKSRITQELAQRGIDEAQIKQLQRVLQTCEMALYAGMTSQDSMQSVYKEAQECIVQLDHLGSK